MGRADEEEEDMVHHREVGTVLGVDMDLREVAMGREADFEEGRRRQDGMAEVEEGTDRQREAWRWVCVVRPDRHRQDMRMTLTIMARHLRREVVLHQQWNAHRTLT